MTGRKKFFEPKQKIIVPKGTIPPNEVAIIEMPKTLRRNSVCIVEKKEGESSSRYLGRPSSYDDLDASSYQSGVTPVSGEYSSEHLPRPRSTVVPSLPAFPSGFSLTPPQIGPPQTGYQQATSAPVCPAMQPAPVCPAVQRAPVCPAVQSQGCGVPRPMMAPLQMMQQMPFPQMGFSQPFQQYQCQPHQQQQQQQQPGAYILFFYNPSMPGFPRHRCQAQVQQTQCVQQAAPSCASPIQQQPQCPHGTPSCFSIQQKAANVQQNNLCSQPSSSRFQWQPGQFGYNPSSSEKNRSNRSKSPARNLDFNSSFNLPATFSNYTDEIRENELNEKEEKEQKQLERDLKNFQKARRQYVGRASILAENSAVISGEQMGKGITNKNHKQTDEYEYDDEDETDDDDEDEIENSKGKKENERFHYYPRKKFGSKDFYYNDDKSTKSNKKFQIKNLAFGPRTKKKVDDDEPNKDNDNNNAKEEKYKQK